MLHFAQKPDAVFTQLLHTAFDWTIDALSDGEDTLDWSEAETGPRWWPVASD